MKVKTVPEDFIVVEQARHAILPQGPYILCEMAKRNMTTERALSLIAERVDVPRRMVGYAGTKDARALTRQYITIKNSPLVFSRLEKFSREGLNIRVLGCVREPLTLGALDANRFEIVVRELDEGGAHALHMIPNYFDEQRFSTDNVAIGRLILKKQFVEAARRVLATQDYAGERIRDHLAERPMDGVGALRLIPKHLLLMYVHAYQSFLFNEVLSEYIRMHDPLAKEVMTPLRYIIPSKDIASCTIPIVGFATQRIEPFYAQYMALLAKDGLEERDFVIRSIPELSSEGSSREAFFPVQDLALGPLEDDDLHSTRRKQTLSFTLPKGCYATMVLKMLFASYQEDAESASPLSL